MKQTATELQRRASDSAPQTETSPHPPPSTTFLIRWTMVPDILLTSHGGSIIDPGELNFCLWL
jgi:hypothetical protein